jgi:geranyl-CoA carboxylase alpha subunit
VKLDGHAIEVRLYAEDPYAGFLPQTGTVAAWRPAEGPGLRTDHGMRDCQAISAFYDPMIAKVIAHGASRAEAVRKLARALEQTVVLGPTTNRHFLLRMLRHPVFAAGEATTAFIGRHFDAAALTPPAPTEVHWALAGALIFRRSAAGVTPLLAGWRNSNPVATTIRLSAGEARQEVLVEGDGSRFAVRIGERAIVIEMGAETDVWLRVAVDGVQRRVQALWADGRLLLDLDGLSLAFADITHEAALARDGAADGVLRAPMDGRIVSIRVGAGDAVEKGQTLVVLEAMKMQHQIRAASAGTVATVSVREGEQVSGRAILVTLAPAPGG